MMTETRRTRGTEWVGWWTGLGLEGVRLRDAMGDTRPGVDGLLADARNAAELKFGKGVAPRRRVFQLLHTAFHAERGLRRANGVTGNTHEQIRAAMTAHGHPVSAGTTESWLRRGTARMVRVDELIVLLSSPCFSPPVRRWFAEQLGCEMGFSIAFDLDHDRASLGPTDLRARVVELLAAAGLVASGVRDALGDGVVSDDERDAVRSRVRAVMGELAKLDAELANG